MTQLCRALCIACGLAIAGCAGSGKTGNGPRPSAIDRAQSWEQNLQQLAEREAAKRPGTGFLAVPRPPGVDAEPLALREAADEKSRQPLTEVLALYAERLQPDAANDAQPVSPGAAAEALKRYTKARTAALDGRTLQAIVELQKAHELDPDSVQIMRELARCYLAENRTTQAVEIYERLIRIEPDNADALFALGLATANRRDFENALSALARLERANAQLPDREPDPAALILVRFTIATALRELGYDRAFIEAARAAADFPEDIMASEHAVRLAPVYRQRGELWRAMGDAHCRLGEFEPALEAYTIAATLPLADPNALHQRLIYANLCLKRPHSAQLALYQLFNKPAEAGQPPVEITAREIHLCAYVKDHAGSVDVLSSAVGNLYRSRPNDSMLMRAAAALAPPERAREILRDFVARKPRDVDGVGELLAWVAAPPGDATHAADLALTLAQEHPDLADAYTERLAIAVPRPGELLAAIDAMPVSPARARMEVKLLWRAGGFGEAWAACEAARKQWPDDQTLVLQQLQLAATLQEPVLFDHLLETAPAISDVSGLLGLSQAQRALGRTTSAIALVEQAAALEPENVSVSIELARAWLAHAAALSTDPNARAESRNAIDHAIEFAEKAIEADPKRDDAYEVLALIYMPGGSLADTDRLRQSVQRLRDANPASALLMRLAAQDAIGQRRYEQAVDRLLNTYDNNPMDTASLNLAVSAWQQWGKLDAADEWITQRLAKRPGDPALLEQWVRVQLLRDRSEVALKKLEDAVAADAHDILARRLLETVYRATGRTEAALDLGEKRLLARPAGMRREIELAALYAGAEWPVQALERLEWVRANASLASAEELASAVRIINRIEIEPARRDALNLEFVRLSLHKDPASPLQVYGSGLRALARANKIDADFDTLAEQAALSAKGASGSSAQAADEWRELAQALVDDGHPAAAGRAVRARLRSAMPLDDLPRGALTIIALVADAAAQAADPQRDCTGQSLQLLRDLEERGKLHVIFENATRAKLADAVYEVSVFYTLLGSRAGADLLLEEALAANPNHAMALNNLGYARLEAGHRDERTIQMIERAMQLQPNEANILDTVGWLRYKQGKFSDEPGADDGKPVLGALTHIARCIADSNTPSPEVVDHLGDVRWRRGEKDAAVEAWRQAAKIVEDGGYRKWITQNFQAQQSRGWQLLVIDPEVMYDREYGPILERARKKIAAVEADEEPPVARIFEEY
jgi:tetratricopeptide (TPR) repeat protein